MRDPERLRAPASELAFVQILRTFSKVGLGDVDSPYHALANVLTKVKPRDPDLRRQYIDLARTLARHADFSGGQQSPRATVLLIKWADSLERGTPMDEKELR